MTSRVTIDLEPGLHPVSGDVRAGTTVRPFTGWLELLALLRSAVAAAGAEDDTITPTLEEP